MTEIKGIPVVIPAYEPDEKMLGPARGSAKRGARTGDRGG